MKIIPTIYFHGNDYSAITPVGRTSLLLKKDKKIFSQLVSIDDALSIKLNKNLLVKSVSVEAYLFFAASVSGSLSVECCLPSLSLISAQTEQSRKVQNSDYIQLMLLVSQTKIFNLIRTLQITMTPDVMVLQT